MNTQKQQLSQNYFDGINDTTVYLERHSIYNKLGNCIEYDYYSFDGKIRFKQNYNYDRYENLTLDSTYDFHEGKTNSIKYSYIYDKHNNWVEMQITQTGTISKQINKRQIEYY